MSEKNDKRNSLLKGTGGEDYGKQKHPPQLNPLAFLPVSQTVSAPTRRAYEMRYEITERAEEPFFYGWTLGEFLLSSSRMANAGEWKKDWDNALRSEYVDPERIQIYETSRAWGASFYTTTHGLFTQSILDCIVSDWWGQLRVGGCVPWRGEISFEGIRTLLGVNVSGQINAKEIALTLHAQKDAIITCHGHNLSLRKGEEHKLTLPGREPTAGKKGP